MVRGWAIDLLSTLTVLLPLSCAFAVPELAEVQSSCVPRDGAYVTRWRRLSGDCPESLDGTAHVAGGVYAGPDRAGATRYVRSGCRWDVTYSPVWDVSGKMQVAESVTWRSDAADGSAVVSIEAEGERCDTVYAVEIRRGGQ